jgi:hypothetical protein
MLGVYDLIGIKAYIGQSSKLFEQVFWYKIPPGVLGGGYLIRRKSSNSSNSLVSQVKR